jgi:hypothetical protein
MKTKFIEATLMPEVHKYHFDLRIKRKTKERQKKKKKKKKNQVNGNSYPQKLHFNEKGILLMPEIHW